MVYTEIIAVCSQIHTKQTNTLCGQNVELVNVKLAVLIVTTRAGFSEFSLVYRYVKSNVSSVPAIFSYLNKEPVILVRLADSRNKLCDAASNVAY